MMNLVWPKRIDFGLAVENSPSGRQADFPEGKIR
jgi:hypothetical protein